MKTRSLLVTSLALAMLIVPASSLSAAKADGLNARALAKFDTNKNGKLDPDEFAAIRTEFAALAKIDADKDGKLSDEELAGVTLGAGKRVKSDADRTARKAKRAEKKKSVSEPEKPAEVK